MIRWIIGTLLLAGLAACSKTNQAGNHPPQITLISVTPQEFSVSERDTVLIAFTIDDKDGDIGTTNTNNTNNLFISFAEGEFGTAKLPVIPDALRNPETGFHGVAVVKLPATRIVLDSLQAAVGDTASLRLHIKDIAGNTSDTITTPELILHP